MTIETLIQNKEFISIIVSAVTMLVAMKVKVAVLESRLDRIDKDLDGIALSVGTPRAIARAKAEIEAKGQ